MAKLHRGSLGQGRASWRRLLAAALAAVLSLSLAGTAGCGGGPATDDNPGAGEGRWGSPALDAAPYGPYTAQDGTWAVYWYVCGSDIELRDDMRFNASGQIMEMMQVTLPDNVTVVIQAGGAKAWHLDAIDPSLTNRLVYRGSNLTVAETQPQANMGAAETFADFLAFCNLNYPAEHQMIIIYDHGGGSLHGIAFDDLYNMDSLTLPELSDVIKSRPAASGTYEVIGMAACLMATIDCVAIFKDYARYMVASEEVALGCEWDFEKVFAAIASDPNIGGARLGKVIADGYYAQCEQVGYTAYTTTSVIDLSRADQLLAAYNDVGIELLRGAAANGAEHVASLGRAAYASENYGAIDSPASKYDMVDLGDLVIQARALLPESSSAMLDAIDAAMSYHVTNPLRQSGRGISCFYPYTGSDSSYKLFAALDTSLAFRHYFDYVRTGSLSEEGVAYLESLSPTPGSEPELLPEPIDLGLDNHIIVYGDSDYCPGSDGQYLLDLGVKANSVANIYLEIGVYDRDTEDYWLSGTTDFFVADWERGMFYDTFRGTSPCIDGAYCYTEAVNRGDDYVIYRIPVLHNGVEKSLMAMELSAAGQERLSSPDPYVILGLISSSASGIGSAEAVYEELQVGDVIEPILLYNNRYNFKEGTGFVLSDDEVVWNPHISITVTENTRFYYQGTGPGSYMVRFMMIDYSGAIHLSKPGYYHVYPDGEIEYEPIG